MTIDARKEPTVSGARPEPPVDVADLASSGGARTFWGRLRSLIGDREKPGPIGKRRERWFYLMILLWIVGFLAFHAGPILAAFGLSFSNFHLTRGVTWVGLEHYRSLVQDPLVLKTLGNTIYYTLGSVILGLLIAFGLALLLNQRIGGINIFRTVFFLPSVVSGVAVIMLWGMIFNPEFGMLNSLLEFFGIQGPAWLHSETWAMPAVILMSVWNIGWMMLVFLAGLQGIPKELYEAAEIDGASTWDKTRYVTIPLISPVTFFLLVTNIIFSFQVFTPTYVLTRGGPNNATMTISLLIFLAAFQWNRMGFATALAVVLFVIILSVTGAQFFLSGRWVHYETEVD